MADRPFVPERPTVGILVVDSLVVGSLVVGSPAAELVDSSAAGLAAFVAGLAESLGTEPLHRCRCTVSDALPDALLASDLHRSFPCSRICREFDERR